MQTEIAPRFQNAPRIVEADAILRSCVHCGFCTATCPTYQILGDELDGPRGRIYLIKEFLAGSAVSSQTLTHLDRCLTCRACETTCPSGVRYARLAEIGREYIESEIPRPAWAQIQRSVLRAIVPYPERFRLLLQLGGLFKPFLPETLAGKIPDLPPAPSPKALSAPARGRKVIALAGCVQSVMTPATEIALEQILGHLGISIKTPSTAGCCGALSLHLNAHDEAHHFMRRNIDAWWPLLEDGAEAILVSASGCGSMVKEYGEALQEDRDYAEKAAQVAALARDPSEWLVECLDAIPFVPADRGTVAFHSPCSLQHGQKIQGKVEMLLERAGYRLTTVRDPHLCCGSAGTYSILQPELSQQLRSQKLDALHREHPDCLATANIGCQLHLQGGTDLPVKHWLELIAAAMA
ncbi:MAG: glycolate oxidase subunit GlcF [Acidithiobacillus sp.]